MQNGISAQMAGIAANAVSLLFVYAGLRKLFYRRQFTETLRYIPHLPLSMAPAVSILLPLAEFTGGLGMLLGSRFGICLTLLLLAGTSAIAAIAIRQRVKVPCVCFTSSHGQNLSRSTLVRNLVMAIAISMPLFVPSATLDPLVLAYGAVTAVLYLTLDAAFRNHMALHGERDAL